MLVVVSHVLLPLLTLPLVVFLVPNTTLSEPLPTSAGLDGRADGREGEAVEEAATRARVWQEEEEEEEEGLFGGGGGGRFIQS